MKKILKNTIIFWVICFIILMVTSKVLASNTTNSLMPKEYSEEFKKWLNLSEQDKQKVMLPRMYDVESSEVEYKNPLYYARMLGSSNNDTFNLKTVIPENLIIKNQQDTQSCWTFAAISSLETNLALFNKRSGINASKVYDFSERHMEYATSKTFANNEVNPIGYNRTVGSGGNWEMSESYLTNGSGAIPESELQFENNENTIDISAIKNKTISSQVYDTIDFENYRSANDEERTEIMNKIKQHIKNYGSVYASIHGNSSDSSLFKCYNNDTGAKYCNNYILHGSDHAVSIIGWNDGYSVDNFAEESQPSSPGAWIIRNSWGERQEENLLELKQEIYNEYTDECNEKGWTEATLIPNDFIEKLGYTIEGEIAYIPIGDNGLMYVSYEDANIADGLFGIVKASDNIDYDKIYQYDNYYPVNAINYTSSKIMLGNIFDKGSSTEYLTQVSLYAPETYTCRVYVNPNNSSFKKEDLQLISLKAGESETLDVGYHTLEFSKPIALTGKTFAVIVEITSSDYSTDIFLESKLQGVETFNAVTVENGKCFMADSHDLDRCNWLDLGKLAQTYPSVSNGDSTIKAFTTNKLIDESLESIKITTPPSKTTYFEGDNFDKTGMVVTAYYNSKTKPSVILDSSDYSISNGTKLKAGQTEVTITYENKSVKQNIEVEKNSVTELEITTSPTKTIYKEGQSFDKTGMIVEATRKKGNKEIVTNYTIENGNNLKVDQTEVTISYEGKTVKQDITVIPNPLIEIKIDKAPDKTNYVVGQNFDKTGMTVIGVYQDESTVEIIDYTIENGTNLTKEQTSVTISYLGKTAIQDISVVEKRITGISINKNPNKLKYIQNEEELDLTGGIISVAYNDGTRENIDMNSNQITVTGFNNNNIGKITIELEYLSNTVNLELEIVEKEKAVNTDLTNASCDVTEIKAYYFTKDSQKDYTLMNVVIKGLKRNLTNDNVEYYYYLSTSKDEKNITEWTKITEKQNSDNELKFTINSKDILNYESISRENVLYLYVKEVATKGANQSVATSKGLAVESDVEIKIYIDNAKQENFNSGNISNGNGNTDNTIAGGLIPQTGIQTIAFIVLAIIIFGGICYYKYYKLKDAK